MYSDGTPHMAGQKAGWPAQTYIQQLCEDTRCSPEDLPEMMNDWEKWWERVRDIRASGMTWWRSWWWGYYNFMLRLTRDLLTIRRKHCIFQYNSIFLWAKIWFTLSPTLSRVLTCLFLEFLKSGFLTPPIYIYIYIYINTK